MEAGIAVLNHTVLVFDPHEHVVRVEDVFALLTLFIVSEAQGVAALVIGFTVDGLEDVLGVVLEHLLGGVGQLARVILVLLVQLLVSGSAVLGQGRCVHGVAISCLVNAVLRRAGGNDALVRTTGLEPHTTRNGVRNLGLGRSRADRAFRVLNELVALGGHPAGFVVRRNFLVERRHQLDVAVSRSKRAKRGLDQAIKGAGNEAVSLAEHDNLVAALVRKRLNPNAVLLVSTCGPGVLFAELIGPGDALIARTEREGALTAVTANDIGQGVGLRAEDWRVGAVLVTELRINGDAVHLDVAVVTGRARVAVRAGQVHVTRDEAFAHTVGIGQVRSLLDTTAGDHVGVDNLLILSGFIGHRGDARCSLSRLCSHGPVEAARSEARGHAGHQSQSQSS